MAINRINHASMRSNNSKAVLDAIRFSDGISRKALASQIGLTAAAITNIVNALLEEGYIVEKGELQSNASGRRQIELAINPAFCYEIGVELSASKIICLLADFSTHILAKKIVPISKEASVDAIVGLITSTIDNVIRDSGVSRDAVRGIGLATPGPYDLNAGTMINPPNLKSFSNIPIRDIIQQKTGFPVEFEHHMAAAGFCEAWMGDAKDSKCMFLCSVLDVGIAGSALIDGKIFHGFCNGSGEIGHMIIEPNGELCTCGNRGCLEPLADARALIHRVRQAVQQEASVLERLGVDSADAITLDLIIERGEAGDPLCELELKKCAQYVAIALSNIIMILSPDTIVLSGDLPDKSALYVHEIIQYIRNRPYPSHNRKIKIYNTRFKRDISALGGIAIVLNEISEKL